MNHSNHSYKDHGEPATTTTNNNDVDELEDQVQDDLLNNPDCDPNTGATAASSSSSLASSSTKEHKLSDEQLLALYSAWDPMAEEDSSFLNTPQFKNYLADPSTLITGSASTTTKTNEIQCPFYSTSNGETCFKSKCGYKHDKQLAEAMEAGNQIVIDSLQSKSMVPTAVLDDLPPKQIATEGCFMVGSVVNVVNPWEFYVIPQGDWSCICHKSCPSETTQDHKYSGLDNLTYMWTRLDYYGLKLDTAGGAGPGLARQSLYYNQGELVAVKLTTGPKAKQWFRGIVLQDVGLDETNEAPMIQLRLLDLGTLVHTSVKNVIPLPKQLLAYPALAYKCSLFGISPITHKWSKKAIELFRVLVQEQSCLIEIKKSISEPPPILSFETHPYKVSLRVKVNEAYINVAHKLADDGLGLEWHPFPARPHILDALPPEEARAYAELVKPLGKQGSPAHPSVPEETVARELSRLNNYLNRTNPTRSE